MILYHTIITMVVQFADYCFCSMIFDGSAGIIFSVDYQTYIKNERERYQSRMEAVSLVLVAGVEVEIFKSSAQKRKLA
jgi:Mg2+/citrate symporter